MSKVVFFNVWLYSTSLLTHIQIVLAQYSFSQQTVSSFRIKNFVKNMVRPIYLANQQMSYIIYHLLHFLLLRTQDTGGSKELNGHKTVHWSAELQQGCHVCFNQYSTEQPLCSIALNSGVLL